MIIRYKTVWKNRITLGMCLTISMVAGFEAVLAVSGTVEADSTGHRAFEPVTMIRATIVACRDGDTFEVTIDTPVVGFAPRETVRLLGVDAPEMKGKGERSEHAEKALKYVKRRLLHRSVHLAFDREPRDDFGRLLAYVYMDEGGSLFNAELLRKGLACLYTIKHHRMFEEFRALQDEAISSEAGMWGALPEKVTIVYIYNHGKDEHVIIKNNTPQAVDVSRWYIKDGSDNVLLLPDGVILQPKGMIAVYSGANGFDEPPRHVYVTTKNVWGNRGDTAYLYGEGDILLDEYSY